MTTTLTNLDVIEHLDFDPELPCEFEDNCEHAATVLVQERPCIGCGDDADSSYFVCAVDWAEVAVVGLTCIHCNASMTREQGWEVLRWLRGAS